jgi:hypothetical protein
MLIGKLNMWINVRVENKNGRKMTLTDCFVRLGDKPVARRTIPGKWNEQQALTEFKRFPDRFTSMGTLDATQIKALAA